MGFILEDHGSWAFKTYSSVDIKTGKPLGKLGENGKPLRKQQSVQLCRIDEDHKSKNSHTVLELCADRMKRIEAWEAAAAAGESNPEAPNGNIRVCDFYRNVFLPMIKSKPNVWAAATVDTYESYWDSFLADHFNGTKTLKNYQAYMGRQFLDFLRKEDGTPYGENTVKKIHSTASGIFTEAVECGYIDHNPWKDIKRSKAPSTSAEEGVAYSENEVETMISNLEGDIDGRKEASVKAAQVALGLSIWAGLRPSEICGLKWVNVDTDTGKITVKSAVVSRVEKGTKTGKERIVTILSPLVPMLRRWKAACGNPTTGWVLQNRDGNPINMNDIGARIIGPNCGKAGIEWIGLYGCRRGFGTLLVNHGATVEQVAQAMGNTPSVVWKYYFKDDKCKLAEGAAAKYEQGKRAGELSGDSNERRTERLLTGGVGGGQ